MLVDTHAKVYIVLHVMHIIRINIPYGVCLYAIIKVADQTITCTTTKPNNIIQMNFDLDFCDECTK